MRLKASAALIIFVLCFGSGFAQIREYGYLREITGVSGQWHRLVLPDEIFGRLRPGFPDIRVFGITPGGDTTEAPYLLRRTKSVATVVESSFNTINVSHNDKGHFFTFEASEPTTINQIDFTFNQNNFDWLLVLEGSHDQLAWFTILENYRIVSINNPLTNYSFTKVSFPSANYRYYRLLVKSKEKPGLLSADFSQKTLIPGVLKTYLPTNTTTAQDKERKQTLIDIELPLPVPLSSVEIGVNEIFDYYRPLKVSYLTDSTGTANGWHHNYLPLATGTLNSMEANAFSFPETVVKKLRVTVHNHDNPPLTFSGVEVKGHVHELVIRITEPGTYFLAYGNARVAMPVYDLGRFAQNIPEDLTLLQLGGEQSFEQAPAGPKPGLFANQAWLWAVMGAIMLSLGWFSFRMIRKSDEQT